MPQGLPAPCVPPWYTPDPPPPEYDNELPEIEVVAPTTYNGNGSGNYESKESSGVKVSEEVYVEKEIPQNNSTDISQEELDAMSQLQCSLDNPEACQSCGS